MVKSDKKLFIKRERERERNDDLRIKEALQHDNIIEFFLIISLVQAISLSLSLSFKLSHLQSYRWFGIGYGLGS